MRSGRFLPEPSAGAASRAPLVLVADAQEWFARALETVLLPAGYSVLKAYTARGVLEQVELTEPDAVILAVDLPGGDGLNLTRVLREAARTSDALGRIGPREFAVIAPETGADAARRLAERLAGALVGQPRRPTVVPTEFLAGYAAVADAATPKFDPATLLAHASAALATATRDPAGGRIRQYESGSREG